MAKSRSKKKVGDPSIIHKGLHWNSDTVRGRACQLLTGDENDLNDIDEEDWLIDSRGRELVYVCDRRSLVDAHQQTIDSDCLGLDDAIHQTKLKADTRM